jgi:protein-tyrosine phosphatase
MHGLELATLTLGRGELGLCPIPGRGGDYLGDLATLLHWAPTLVFSMTTAEEMARAGAAGLADDLARAGIGWRHLPVADFAAHSLALATDWHDAAQAARTALDAGKRVLVHCYGGCGRSGMAVLRLMVEAGELADPALARLRDVRPCAVETDDQLAWAAQPMWGRLYR